MMGPRLLVSACLAGVSCRYDGQSRPIAAIIQAVREGRMVAVCPEVEGGLLTPRIPCERRGDRVYNQVGEDKTAAFLLGAERAWAKYQQEHCCGALLQARSPSCGVTSRYDGQFRNQLIPGFGMTAEYLHERGVPLFEDSQWEEALAYLSSQTTKGGEHHEL